MNKTAQLTLSPIAPKSTLIVRLYCQMMMTMMLVSYNNDSKNEEEEEDGNMHLCIWDNVMQ